MVVVLSWLYRPTFRDLFIGGADWLIVMCPKTSQGFEQLTYLPRLLSEFQVVKIASFVQQVDQ